MPFYLFRCNPCGETMDVFSRMADAHMERRCPRCGYRLERVYTPPHVANDGAYAYDCPVTGRTIRGKAEHEANLKRHGCRVLEKGDAARAIAKAKAGSPASDALVDRCADEAMRHICSLPAKDYEAVASAVANSNIKIERR